MLSAAQPGTESKDVTQGPTKEVYSTEGKLLLHHEKACSQQMSEGWGLKTGREGTSWAMKRSPTVIATFAKLNQSDKFYYIYIISYYS